MTEKCTYVELVSYTEVKPCDKEADVMITTFGVKKPRCSTHAQCEKNALWRIKKSVDYDCESVGK